MLTLGSIPLDAAQLADIRKGARLRARVERNPDLLARQVRLQLKDLFAVVSHSSCLHASQFHGLLGNCRSLEGGSAPQNPSSAASIRAGDR